MYCRYVPNFSGIAELLAAQLWEEQRKEMGQLIKRKLIVLETLQEELFPLPLLVLHRRERRLALVTDIFNRQIGLSSLKLWRLCWKTNWLVILSLKWPWQKPGHQLSSFFAVVYAILLLQPQAEGKRFTGQTARYTCKCSLNLWEASGFLAG